MSRLALAAVAVASLDARAATVEERLAALEQQVEQLKTENKALRTQLGADEKAIAAVALPVTPNGKESKLVLGGFVQFNGETGGAPDARWAGIADRFYVRRARLNATATFAEGFSARIEGAFGNNSISARSGYSVQATDAYVQWSKHPEFTLRGGQFKTPFGYEQLISDLKTFLVERSLPNDRLTYGRQIGVAASGEVAAKRINYSVGVFNGNGTNNGGNDNENFMTGGRLAIVGFDGKTAEGQALRWTAGANALTTYDNGAFTGRKNGYGVDTQLVAGPAEFWAEWLRQDASPAIGADTTAEGWSMLGRYNFTAQWQGAVRYETYDSNTALMNTTTRTWTFGVNYLIKGDDLKLSLDYLAGHQPAPAGHDSRLIGRMQVVF